MKTYSYITASLTLLGFLLGSTPAYLYAAPADKDSKSAAATLLCFGAYKVQDDGTGTATTVQTRGGSWSFKNYNDSSSIQIDRIRIFDRDGVSLLDEMPPTGSSNGVDPSNVGPHSTITFGAHPLLGETHPEPVLPLQFILDWSSVSGKRVLTLDGTALRKFNRFDGTPEGLSIVDCRTI